MLTRLARWWLRRKTGMGPYKVDATWTWANECEVCGQAADHRIVSGADDDPEIGVTEGGTLMAADFCGKHCPGGCRTGCPVRT